MNEKSEFINADRRLQFVCYMIHMTRQKRKKSKEEPLEMLSVSYIRSINSALIQFTLEICYVFINFILD